MSDLETLQGESSSETTREAGEIGPCSGKPVESPAPIICHCSFCGKNNNEVDCIVSGTEVWQCVECWLIALEVFRPYLEMQVERVYSIELKSKTTSNTWR